MERTPASLLEKLRLPGEQEGWRRFVELFTPVLFSWARQLGLRIPDAADLVQDVFAILVRELPRFHYDPGKSFRAWLKTVTLNEWRRQRARARIWEPVELDELPGPEVEAFWERDYRRHLLGRALRVLQRDFQPSTWKAFWEHEIVDRPAADVAAELGLTVGAVYAARFRVLTRLRQELADLLS